MKRIILGAMVALIAVNDTSRASETDTSDELEISIRDTGKTSIWSNGKITVELRNVGNSTLYLPKALTPLYTPDDHLMNSLFKVVDERGVSAQFIGQFVHVIAVDGETFYARLEPGAVQSHELDLSRDYKLETGARYTVSYEQRYAHWYKFDKRTGLSDDSVTKPSEKLSMTYHAPVMATH